jgi:hypothetical protein
LKTGEEGVGSDGRKGARIKKERPVPVSAVSALAQVSVAAGRSVHGNGNARWQALACNY